MTSRHMLLLLPALLALTAPAEEFAWMSQHATLRLSVCSRPLALTFTADGVHGLDPVRRAPLAEIQTRSGGRWRPSDRAIREQNLLHLEFNGGETVVTLEVETCEAIILRVAAIRGTRPQAIRFAGLNTSLTETVGQRLVIGWNRNQALALIALTPQTETRVEGQPRITRADMLAGFARGLDSAQPHVRLIASTQDLPDHRMEGAAVAILACPTPVFPGILRRLAAQKGWPGAETPDGEAFRAGPAARASALALDAPPLDVERLLRLCRDTGIRQILLTASAWQAPGQPGRLNPRLFPDGPDSLRAFATRLASAGIGLGLHAHTPDYVGPAAEPARRALAALFPAASLNLLDFACDQTDSSDPAAVSAQEHVLRLIGHPVLFVGNRVSQRLWSAQTRASTAQFFPGTLPPRQTETTLRQRVDARVEALLDLRRDLMPADLGWFDFHARQSRDGRPLEALSFDDLEYLLARSVAFDAPITFLIRFQDLERHPAATELIRLIALYETHRLARRFSEADCAPMRQPGRDFTLILRRERPPALAAVRPISGARHPGVRAMVGPFEGGSVATFWHTSGQAHVTLDLHPFLARISDFNDQRVVVGKTDDDRLILPVTTRRLTLMSPRVNPADLERRVRQALASDP